MEEPAGLESGTKTLIWVGLAVVTFLVLFFAYTNACKPVAGGSSGGVNGSSGGVNNAIGDNRTGLSGLLESATTIPGDCHDGFLHWLKEQF